MWTNQQLKDLIRLWPSPLFRSGSEVAQAIGVPFDSCQYEARKRGLKRPVIIKTLPYMNGKRAWHDWKMRWRERGVEPRVWRV